MRRRNLAIIVTALVLSLIILNLIPFTNEFDEEVPSYINRDNSGFGYKISAEEIALGRVLFYDKQLSINNSISCASCHQQEFAFSDTSYLSLGQNGGETGRHSMRLINTRFSMEEKFFWDERAVSLEDQTSKPIQDHIEMGFSGIDGNPNLDSLIEKIEKIDYYQELFTMAFEEDEITEEKIQKALAQFVRSIQSFDSKYDVGRGAVNNNQVDFPNFSDSENRGKQLFMSNPIQNGAGCNRCHRAPEFAIGPNAMNNGVIGVPGDSTASDINITRAPTLRDLVNPQGYMNGPLMHDASITSLSAVINHYNEVPNNPGLDNRLRNAGGNLQLTASEKVDLENFLLTLTGKRVYTHEKYASPFDMDNRLNLSELLSMH
ncbi:cytochrome-c peroxidase [Cyclobacterium qasimii]|nr:cytochrome c peroxidase [Cyclobacterium qasimii]